MHAPRHRLRPTSGSAEYRATSEDSTGGNGATCTTVTDTDLLQTAAAASQNPVTGASVELTALGGNDTGLPDFTYTWGTLGTPPAPVTFTDNSDNTAKSVGADFSAAGTYDLEVTVADGAISTTSDVSVTVDQTASDLEVSPTNAYVPAGQTEDFTADTYDQFGNSMSNPSDLTWSVTSSDSNSPGSIGSSSGVYTAPSGPADSFTVTAASSSTSLTDSTTINAAETNGPVGDWQLNSGDGTTATDASGYGNEGTLQNSPAWDGAADRSTGLYFDGSDQYVSVPDNSTLDPTGSLTVAAYINPTTWASGAVLLQKGSYGSQQYVLFASDSSHLEFQVGGVGDVIAAAPTAGQWDSIVGTYNGSTIALYVNGTETSTSATGSINTSSDELDIGDGFEGTIAEAKLYNLVPSSISGVFPAPTVATAAAASSSTITGTTVDLTAASATAPPANQT